MTDYSKDIQERLKRGMCCYTITHPASMGGKTVETAKDLGWIWEQAAKRDANGKATEIKKTS